jgi:REP element-mobilizing transposase RayT
MPETRPIEDVQLYVLDSREAQKQEELFATRRRLPHYMPDDLAIMVTLAQHDAVPREMIERVRADYELALSKAGTDEDRGKIHKAYCRAVERLLDQHCHGDLTGDVAAMVDGAIQFMSEHEWLKLHAYVIMPNHVHVLGCSGRKHVSNAIEDFKHYTTTQFHGVQPDVSGSLWQRECFDRWIRDMRHFWTAVRYIHANPVKAELCGDVLDWPYSSAGWYV